MLPKTILNVIERQKLIEQLTALEIAQKRLEAIQGMVMKITQEIRLPLDAMRIDVGELIKTHGKDNRGTYLKIIKENLVRIEKKITRLKDLKSDKTVTYIKDIRMFDISD